MDPVEPLQESKNPAETTPSLNLVRQRDQLIQKLQELANAIPKGWEIMQPSECRQFESEFFEIGSGADSKSTISSDEQKNHDLFLKKLDGDPAFRQKYIKAIGELSNTNYIKPLLNSCYVICNAARETGLPFEELGKPENHEFLLSSVNQAHLLSFLCYKNLLSGSPQPTLETLFKEALERCSNEFDEEFREVSRDIYSNKKARFPELPITQRDEEKKRVVSKYTRFMTEDTNLRKIKAYFSNGQIPDSAVIMQFDFLHRLAKEYLLGQIPSPGQEQHGKNFFEPSGQYPRPSRARPRPMPELIEMLYDQTCFWPLDEAAMRHFSGNPAGPPQ